MIKNGTSNIRKFQFFDLVKENNLDSLKNDNIENINEDKLEESSEINLDNISISAPKQMFTMDGLIFINGKATHKTKEGMIRENLIIKILDNKIIDEFRFFNILYYHFSVKKFEEKPYFILLGSDLKKNLNPDIKEMFMMTSIKIYDANLFIKSKNKIDPEIELKDGYDSYPKNLIKKIELFKRASDGKLFCYSEGERMIEYESFQNINAFSINDDFTHAAISIDRGGIILIYGYPNLIECNNKEINLIYLPKIMFGEKEVNITNLEFAVLKIQNEKNRILYATTGNSIYYYIWKYSIDKNSNAERNIILKELNQERIGAYNGCIAVKENSLLVAASNDNFIGEYQNLEFGKTWFFDGKKTYVDYFNDYILFVIFGESESYLEIYDRKNQFFVFYQANKKRIIGICHDNKYLYVLYEELLNKKYIVKFKEKNLKDKFETFFEKKFFDDAVLYAQNIGFDKKKIAEISLRHAEYEYSKGNYEKSIDEFIKTINFHEPSLVIQKFLEKSKLNHLIKYLEAIIYNMDFKIKDLEENTNYTTLLLHCYIMQEEIDKLKDFIDRKGQNFSQELIKAVIDVCLQTENIQIGLSIAKQHKLIEEYLQILIINLNEYEEALDIIEAPEKYEFKISNEDKIRLLHKFSEYFLKTEEGKEDFSNKFFESVLKFIEENKKGIDKNEIVKLIEIFMDSDKFFKILFGIMESYDLDYNKEIIHRRIQLYLEEYELDKKNILYKAQIINILKNEKYFGKYDSQYLMMLFKNKNFSEGIEILSEIHNYSQDLLFIYMQRKEYEKIINLCKKYGKIELSFWGLCLNYFISKENREGLSQEELDRLNKNLELFLQNLLENKIISPINVVDIIYEKNKDIPFNILNSFISKTLENELISIEDEKNIFNKYDKKIKVAVNEIKELKTKAFVFNLIKCSECGLAIEFPSIVFKCGHGFHTSCINSNINDDTECPKCKDKKFNMLIRNKNSKIFMDKFNSPEKLENELEQIENENKNNYIYELYGKGIFNLGPVKESKNI